MYKRLDMQTGLYELAETAEEHKRRTSPRPRYKTKAEWARAQYDSLMNQAYELERVSSGGSYARAARKYSSVRNLREQAAKFLRMEAAFKRKGV